MTLYDTVEALEPGTVFQTGSEEQGTWGAPWLRIHDEEGGVRDLIVMRHAPRMFAGLPAEGIPQVWRELKQDVRVIYNPERVAEG